MVHVVKALLEEKYAGLDLKRIEGIFRDLFTDASGRKSTEPFASAVHRSHRNRGGRED